MKKPPDEDQWEELKLYNRCTCLEYDWEEIPCPFILDIFEEEENCTCCPFHQQQCGDDI